MALKYDLFSDYKEIETLTKRQLQEVHRQYAKRFNQRIVESKKHDFTIRGTAVKYLERIGRDRYTESMSVTSKMTINQLRQEVWLLNKGLASKTTSVSGRREIERNIMKAFRDKEVKLNDKTMREFLKNMDDIKDSAKVNYNVYINSIQYLSQELKGKNKLKEEDIEAIIEMFESVDNPMKYADEIASKYPTISGEELRKALSKKW